MGYSTDFDGSFDINPSLTYEQQQWLITFSQERHEDRDLPGIWCQWIPKEIHENDMYKHSRSELVWDGHEKFYNYVEWLQYLIDNFFNPRSMTLNGIVKWQGEHMGDRGKIVVVNNIVNTTLLE